MAKTTQLAFLVQRAGYKCENQNCHQEEERIKVPQCHRFKSHALGNHHPDHFTCFVGYTSKRDIKEFFLLIGRTTYTLGMTGRTG